MPYDGFHGDGVDTTQIIDDMLSDGSSGIEAPAAFLIEAIQGEGGLNAVSADWLKAIAAIAKKHGALLIIDDIQAGCGRSGDFFSFEFAGIQPDMVTMAKSLSGYGLPFAMVLTEARARRVHAGRAQRHLPRQQPRLRHRQGGAGQVLVETTISSRTCADARSCWASASRRSPAPTATRSAPRVAA